MSAWVVTVLLAALLGSALIGGVFFAFSTFIMRALSRVPSAEGIRAMQSINVVVLNPPFLGAFFGTAVLSAAIIALVLGGWAGILSDWFFVGSLHYLVGTFGVTAFGNVPLNKRLETVSAEDGAQPWAGYLRHWTLLNHIRTTTALIAAFCFAMGLLQA